MRVLDKPYVATPAANTARTSSVAKRVVWLDVTRGVGIILVVLGHTIDGLAGHAAAGPTASLPEGSLPLHYLVIYQAIYTFHMPLFFFLSGLVFLPSIERRTLPQAFWRRVVTILWPYVLWSYLFIGLKFTMASAVNNPATLSDFLAAPWPPKEHMWFLASLFAVHTLALALKYAGRHVFVIAAGVGLVLLILSAATSFAGADGFVRKTAVVAPFFLLGILYAGYGIAAPRTLTSALFYAATFAVAEAVFFAVSIEQRSFMLPFVALTGVVCVTQCVRWLVDRWSDGWLSGGLAMLGRLSMAIYLAHVLFSAASRMLLERLGVESLTMHVFIGSVAGLAGPVAMYFVLRRFGLTRLFGVGA